MYKIKYEMSFNLKTFPEFASEFGTWRIASAHVRENGKHLNAWKKKESRIISFNPELQTSSHHLYDCLYTLGNDEFHSVANICIL